MIKVENVKKKFIKYNSKKVKEEFYANNGISFEANDGEIVGILGPNGARKNYFTKDDSWNTRTNRRKNNFW